MSHPLMPRPPVTLRRRELLAAGVAPLCCLAPTFSRAQAATAGQTEPTRPDRFEASTPLGRDREGKVVTLEELAGRALVVCFWASWCPHCRVALPVLERVQQSVNPDRLRVLLVNTEPLDDWRQIRRKLEGQFRSQLTNDRDGESRKAFGVPNSVPFTTVIAPDGRSQATLGGWGDTSINWLVEKVNLALAVPKG